MNSRGGSALPSSVFEERLARVQQAMAVRDVDVVMLSVGHDLPYLTGYHAMPLERLTMLVVPREGIATLVIPRLEEPRVAPHPTVFTTAPWNETDDPISLTARLAKGARRVAIGDQLWARFLVELLPHMAGVDWIRAVDVVGPLRRV